MKKTIMSRYITSTAKAIERECLDKYNKSLSFSGIEMILRKDAVIENQLDTGLMVIDIDKYKENKIKYLKEMGLNTKIK